MSNGVSKMEKSILLQKQCRDNTEDLRSYLTDLTQWEEEMKRKEFVLSDESEEPAVPIPRSKSKKLVSTHEKKISEEKEKPKVKKIRSYDYAAWDKFDVDAECDKIDKVANETTESEDEEPSEEYKARLRDEANYEKERGNQFVKNQKWNEAISCYTEAIACYTKDPIYFANRALCFLKKNDLRSAEADCSSALLLEPTYVKALQRRAAAREGLKQLNEAVEDLKRVLEIEPHNKESKLQLEKLEKKLGIVKKISVDSPKPGTSKENLFPSSTETTSKKEVVSPKPSTSKENLLIPISSKTPKEKIIDRGNNETNEAVTEIKKQKNVSAIPVQIPWPERLSSEIILPIQKFPHQRSKKSLRRIDIKESDTSEIEVQLKSVKICDTKIENENLAEILAQSSKLNVDEILNSITNINEKMENAEVKQMAVETNDKQNTESVEKTKEVKSVESMETFDFPVPKSSVQFYSNWKIMKNSNNSKFLYLKRINPKEIPNIFKDSMESDALSDIILILSEYFLENKLPVYEYLFYLSNVRRFSALTMFMSSTDKHALQKLFDHCEASNEATKENLDSLRKKYELY